MGLIYITGISGSGKSAVLSELSKRGIEAHGVDEEGFADWVDRATEEIALFPHDDPTLDIHTWYEQHRWKSSEERIAKLKQHSDSTSQTVFLCGAAEEFDKVRHLFDHIIVLSVDEKTIRTRIENRQDNQFGKTPKEFAEILSWLDGFEDPYRDHGAAIIDATQPLDRVVSEILAVAKHERLRGNLLPSDNTHSL